MEAFFGGTPPCGLEWLKTRKIIDFIKDFLNEFEVTEYIYFIKDFLNKITSKIQEFYGFRDF